MIYFNKRLHICRPASTVFVSLSNSQGQLLSLIFLHVKVERLCMKGCLYVNECCYRRLVHITVLQAWIKKNTGTYSLEHWNATLACFHIFAIFYNIDYFLRRMIVWELPHEISINIEIRRTVLYILATNYFDHFYL